MAQQNTLHLRGGGTSVLVDRTTPGVPAIVHWGPDLGDLADDVLDDIARGVRPQRVSGGLDETGRLTLLPQEAFGWQGTPALLGSRLSGGTAGSDFSSALVMTALEATASALRLTAQDPATRLRLDLEVDVTPTGLVAVRATLTNEGDADYEVQDLGLTLPLPASAREVADTTGRHLRERHPQRHPLSVGRYVRESRRGRPGSDATLLLLAGEPGFGFERGLVHGVHLAWSGNHSLSVERSQNAPSALRAAELLAPGEVVLRPGASYSTPVAFGSWGRGLNELSSRFHEHLRRRPQHPSADRPVTLNTWEAVYFEQDLAHLTRLADLAARVGVERFVLDDGWFSSRRDDTAGLGDWTVSPEVWPDGLAPLVDHVTGLGMQFGLWVEPEMVNPDSDLARAHPDWILQARGVWPASARQQQVLDLSNEEAFDHILRALDALLGEYAISYLKWDHNRDLVEGGSTVTGRSAVHENTLAVYRLMDELKRRHPGLEIESCASGGSRVDLGVIEHTDRVWASDTNDPLERLTIQKYTGLLLPPELIGAHIGAPHAHTTGRHHTLPFRAGVALFGHLGVEWDLASASADELGDLTAWISLYREWRDDIATGALVHADLADDTMDLRGVVARDGSRALFVYAQTASAQSHPTGRLTFPGLDAAATYRVEPLAHPASATGVGQSPLGWRDGVVSTGAALHEIGLQAPVLLPETLAVITVTRVGEATP
ncbi:alpha-galactosidase [Frondihabitans australicus]|uniref:alpha-galactosidase n=1 Tax=Frondihabitans australicus TaxID=386892 RepID=A0A495IH45_9MICO|nr:alpha-galactosidase [Frondihabitans australicus]RKR75333.1 alpha-galactosidase [Frondihabitans australicus]